MYDEQARHHPASLGYTLYTVTDQGGTTVGTVLATNAGGKTGGGLTFAANTRSCGVMNPATPDFSFRYSCSIVL